MNARSKTLSWMALCCAAGAVMAQQAPQQQAQQAPQQAPQQAQQEQQAPLQQALPQQAPSQQAPPQQAPSQQAPPQQAPPQRTSPPAATAQSEAGDPRAETSNSATPGPAPPAAARPPSAGRAAPVPASAPKSAAKIDRLELGTATVTGDREQPKVMYIVPWKRSDIGDLAGKPMNSLVDEILSPVDRDVFKREVVYYRAVQSDASQNGASPKQTQQGEK